MGALPDIQALSPEAFLKPLFHLATSDPTGFGPEFLFLIVEAVLDSLRKEQDETTFLKGLGVCLTSLISCGQTSAVSVCLTLLWKLGEGGGGKLLTMEPDPMLVASGATLVGKTTTGILILEEIACAAAA